MRELVVVSAPYHMGVRGVAVGRGPSVLGERGLGGVAVAGEGVGSVNRAIAAAVRGIAGGDGFPVVVAGNCNSCLGTLAGMQGARTGIVWLDAHGDFHTPETSVSGFLDGMALAAAVGDCQAELCREIGFDQPVRVEDVVLLGVRDLEEAEKERLGRSGVRWRADSELGDSGELLDGLARRVDGVYLHVDVDFLDARESPGVDYRGAGGVPVEEGERLIAEVARRVPLRAAGFTNYNPDHDPELRTCEAVLRLARALREEVCQ